MNGEYRNGMMLFTCWQSKASCFASICFALYIIHWHCLQIACKVVYSLESRKCLQTLVYFVLQRYKFCHTDAYKRCCLEDTHFIAQLTVPDDCRQFVRPSSSASCQAFKRPKTNCIRHTYFYGCLRYYKWISFTLGNERWQRNSNVTMIICRTCLLDHHPQCPRPIFLLRLMLFVWNDCKWVYMFVFEPAYILFL